MIDPSTLRHKRRYLRFSLRGLIVLVLIIGGGLGWMVRSARVQRDAVAAIQRAGGSVRYEWEWKDGHPIHEKPWGPRWLIDRLGIDYFGYVVYAYQRGSDVDMANISRFTHLKALNLGWAGLSDAGLAHLRGLTGLQYLVLDHTRVSDADLSHLARLTDLREFHLSNTPVTDAGLVHLKGLTNLRYLNLQNTQVTDAGVRELQKALPELIINR